MQEQTLKNINRSLESEIAERKASEEKIKDLNHKLLQNIERLESANKELDRFAFMASHDLQEPLRKIITFSDRLHSKYNGKLDDEADMYINRIQSAAERMRLSDSAVWNRRRGPAPSAARSKPSPSNPPPISGSPRSQAPPGSPHRQCSARSRRSKRSASSTSPRHNPVQNARPIGA